MKISPAQIANDDGFRNAFNAIAREIAPIYDHKFGYWSDLLYDAAQCANLEPEQSLILLVRDCGTHCAIHMNAARAVKDAATWIAAFQITRGKYDSFTVTRVEF